MIIRVHTDNTTIDLTASSMAGAIDQANQIVSDGVWDKELSAERRRLYPPHRIVMVELIPS